MVITPLLDDIYAGHVEELGYEIDRIGKKSIGSSDVGNVSYVIPTIQPNFRISLEPIIGHTQGFKEAARSDYGLESIRFCSKALAYTALDLLNDPNLLQDIKKQHNINVSKLL